MSAILPYLFRGEIPTPKRRSKRFFHRYPWTLGPKLVHWAPWVLLGVILYGVLFWGVEYLSLSPRANHLLALVGVITIAACLELASWVQNGNVPLALVPRMGFGGLIAMLIVLL